MYRIFPKVSFVFYEDLSNYCYYLKKPLSRVKNVGWLEKNQPYKTGKVSDDFLPKLSKVILGNDVVDVRVNRIRSAHPCALSDCGNVDISDGERKDNLGAEEIWISSKEEIFFAAPSMIYHYVEKHSYLPLKSFVNDVIKFDLYTTYKAQDIYLKEIKGCF